MPNRDYAITSVPVFWLFHAPEQTTAIVVLPSMESCVEQSSWWTEITWHHSDYVQKQTEDFII